MFVTNTNKKRSPFLLTLIQHGHTVVESSPSANLDGKLSNFAVEHSEIFLTTSVKTLKPDTPKFYQSRVNMHVE